jgi:hypothetical protein
MLLSLLYNGRYYCDYPRLLGSRRPSRGSKDQTMSKILSEGFVPDYEWRAVTVLGPARSSDFLLVSCFGYGALAATGRHGWEVFSRAYENLELKRVASLLLGKPTHQQIVHFSTPRLSLVGIESSTSSQVHRVKYIESSTSSQVHRVKYIESSTSSQVYRLKYIESSTVLYCT